MKSFLGLIGQFRDHVDHFGDLTAPLYELTEDYKNTKSNKIHWTEKLQQSFDEQRKKWQTALNYFSLTTIILFILIRIRLTLELEPIFFNN